MAFILVPLVVGTAIILTAARSYRRHRRTEARVCGDVRRVLARIAPLATPAALEAAAGPIATEPAARS